MLRMGEKTVGEKSAAIGYTYSVVTVNAQFIKSNKDAILCLPCTAKTGGKWHFLVVQHMGSGSGLVCSVAAQRLSSAPINL